MALPGSLDPDSPRDVTAVHEAGHALAIVRLGFDVAELWIHQGPLGWEGNCTHAGLPHQLSPQEIERLNRKIALAGPAAEELFTGHMDHAECVEDFDQANEISEFLDEDPATARAALLARLTARFRDDEAAGAICDLAELVRDRQVLNPEALAGIRTPIEDRVGRGDRDWP